MSDTAAHSGFRKKILLDGLVLCSLFSVPLYPAVGTRFSLVVPVLYTIPGTAAYVLFSLLVLVPIRYLVEVRLRQREYAYRIFSWLTSVVPLSLAIFYFALVAFFPVLDCAWRVEERNLKRCMGIDSKLEPGSEEKVVWLDYLHSRIKANLSSFGAAGTAPIPVPLPPPAVQQK